ncbi:putative Sterol 3-beta-glucosyltransferase (putative) [Pseudozyma hubeiensis]|nr:putative Sterol 3-beta-glucosyltransferase (putative) [Pseudozyma hubeiensis]
MGLRPLFGSRASVNDIHDSFGTTLEAVKTSESEHANPLEQHHSSDAASSAHEEPLSPQSPQPQGGNGLAGFLNGAALMSHKDSQSRSKDRHDNDVAVPLDTQAQKSNVAAVDADSSDDAAAWKKSRNEAETSDRYESSRARSKLGRTLKKVDAKIRSTIGVNAPPTAQEMRSPYSVGNNDHLTSQNNLGAAELLNDARLETLQHLSDDEEDDSDDEHDDVDEEHTLHDKCDQHIDDDNDDARTLRDSDTSPDRAKMQEHVAKLDEAKSSAEQRRSGSMEGVRPGDSVRTRAPVEISPEDKMKAIIEEFGECSSVSQPNEPEKLIVDHNGVLMKTVLIKGSLFLTNRRVCFLAYIPDAASNNDNAVEHHQAGLATGKDSSAIRAPSDPNVDNPILKSGPAVIHRPGKLRPKRSVWMELRKDSFNAYSASNKLYKPLLSARLSNLYAVLPIDWAQPNVIRFVEGLKYSSVEFKTQEAALDWRKELEAAAFHARNTAEKVRISIPLERIVGTDAADFMHVAKILHVDVLVGAVTESEMAQIEQEHRERADGHHIDRSWSSGNSFLTCPKNPGFKCHVTQVAFGVTHNRAAFIDLLREALKASRSVQHSLGYKEMLHALPPALLDLQGQSDVDDGATDSSASYDEQKSSLADKFCNAFGLPHRADELHLVKAELVRTLHTHGTIAIGLDYLLFWRRAVGRDLKIKVPLNDLQGVDTYRSMLWHHFGLVVHIRAHADMYFDFTSKENRDMTLHKLQSFIDAKQKQSKESKINSDGQATSLESGVKSTDGDQTMPSKKGPTETLLHDAVAEVPVFEPDVLALLPKVVNMDRNAMRDAIRISPMRIYCLTIGSRGDVQPYIALCKALKEHGHTPVIVSHPEYRGWVEGHGIEYRGVGGDPAALMKLSVEHRIFSPAFFKESIGKFRVWLDELLRECWEECQGADLLIESPSTMAGIHVAEGLGIPYFRAFTMPWTKTSAYPQAFSVPSIEMGPSYNSSSYTLFDQVMWVATSGQINRWRKHMVGIGATDMSKMDADSVPFIYNFSPAVVPMPNDWGDRVKISGYWFLDNPESNWKPPKEMEEFLERARKDGKKIAYIGFGSITIENAEEVSANIMKAVHEADVRAIVAKGWSGRGGSKKKKKKQQHKQHDAKPHLQHKDSTSSHTESEDTATEEEHEPEITIPDDVFVVDSVPHDWLFPQIDIAMHHGGAGTTGASLRAGLVTLIKPFFGDQFFWANRVAKLGAGARVNGLSVSDLSDALKNAASDRVMVEKAQGVGEKIRSENGVATAIEFLYKNIPLANRRTQRRLEREATHDSTDSSYKSNPLSRFGSHSRQNSASGSEIKEKHGQTKRSATLPPVSTSSSETAVHRSSTIFESPADEIDSPTSPTSPSSGKNTLLPSLPSLSTLNPLPSSMSASLKDMIAFHTSTADTTADGEPAHPTSLTERSATIPPGRLAAGEETEEQKMHRLKGYKNAKAEDIRRRKLLQERLEREQLEKEQQSETHSKEEHT